MPTAAMSMLCVTTPKVHTRVHVNKDILVMEDHVLVSNYG